MVAQIIVKNSNQGKHRGTTEKRVSWHEDKEELAVKRSQQKKGTVVSI